MKNNLQKTGCPFKTITRRNFIAGSAALCGCLISGVYNGYGANENVNKKRIRLVYSLWALKQDRPTWPNKGFDFKPVIEKTNQELQENFKHYEFLVSTASGPEEADKIIREDSEKNIDGYIVFQMNNWPRVIQSIAKTKKPVLYVHFIYGGSGGFLTYTAALIRENFKNVGFVSSSRMDDLIEAVKCFEKINNDAEQFGTLVAETRKRNTPKEEKFAFKQDSLNTLSMDEWLKAIKGSKILAVRGNQSGPAGDVLGIPVVHVPFAELNEAYKNANRDEARGIATRWKMNAAKIEDVSFQTLEDSAAMYLAQKAVMNKYGANAITINCLGGFYGGHIGAYPCLGFHQLLNEGLVGGCECDVRSTATLVAFGLLTKGRPGFISDPVIDTAKRHIIYAHCVASNCPFGPKEKQYPYQILTHSEDRQGASVRAILPEGYLLTTLEVHNTRKEILLHQARSAGNDPDDRACRTKLVAEPIGDIEKLFTMWDLWGWHRVTFYGDLKKHAYALADAIGWKVIEEA